MKILLNRKPINGPWGGGNLFIKNFCDSMIKLGHKVVHTIQKDIDVLFIINPRYDDLGISINEAIKYKQKHPNVKIIQRINDCDARKGTKDVDSLLINCSKHLDMTIFVSEWMKNYFLEKEWKCKNNNVVINGVEVVSSVIDKMNNGKINIVTHHWSDNYLKGFDVYDSLDTFVKKDNNFTFTYIGRDRGTFKNTKVINPLVGRDLYNELKKYDVYISASRFDPGPNHILESINCNLPTFVHKNGGGCVEFAGNDHVFDDFNHLIKILVSKEYVKNKNSFYNWNTCISQYNDILKELVSK